MHVTQTMSRCHTKSQDMKPLEKIAINLSLARARKDIFPELAWAVSTSGSMQAISLDLPHQKYLAK